MIKALCKKKEKLVLFLRHPGSLVSEVGTFAMTFDHTGSRLITCEADKTIKMYKEGDSATKESHLVNWKLDILKRRRY